MLVLTLSLHCGAGAQGVECHGGLSELDAPVTECLRYVLGFTHHAGSEGTVVVHERVWRIREHCAEDRTGTPA